MSSIQTKHVVDISYQHIEGIKLVHPLPQHTSVTFLLTVTVNRISHFLILYRIHEISNHESKDKN